MTDTLHSQVLPTPQRAITSLFANTKGYLFNPWVDFFCLGGGSVILLFAVALLLPKGIPTAQEGALVGGLMLLINQPHFAQSYQIFYRDFRTKAFGASYKPALRARYIVAGIVVPLMLLAFFAIALARSDARLLGYGANLMFFLVGWHYVKQGYGILMVDSVKKGIFFPDAMKTIFRVNGYASWIVAWLAINHAVANEMPYLGLKYFTFDVPTPFYLAACAVAALTGGASVLAMARKWRETGKLPWNGVIAYLTTLYLWVIFVRINPLILAIVPTFHSLQYQVVVWRYQWNASKGASAGVANVGTAVWRGFALFMVLGLGLGFLGFTALPEFFNAYMPYDHHLFGATLFTFLFYIFINVHHYFLDNVMWRRENPDVRKYVFAA